MKRTQLPLSGRSLHEMDHLKTECAMLTQRFVPGYFVYLGYWRTIDLIVSNDRGRIKAIAITDTNYKQVQSLTIREHCTPFDKSNLLLKGVPYGILKELEDNGVDTTLVWDIINKSKNQI